MDLRSIINTEGGDRSAAKQITPVTPVQAAPQHSFREFSHPPQVSPGQQPEYGFQGGGPYASPTQYQGSYPGRPGAPTPLQTPGQNDLHSPAGSLSAQSPYRQTPTSSMSAGQFPFPQSHQSPVQTHQYPPSLQHRESYPPSGPPPPHLQHQNTHGQGSVARPGSATPQTPPVGVPGAPHPFLQHQRSQSSISTSTPTSAHSQQPYFNNQYPQDSPISTNHYPQSQIPQHQRQQSQQSHPGTPLGPPLQGQRQSSGGFVQPTSPYQQRGMPSAVLSHYQTSPAPPPPASIPKLPTTPSGYDSHRTSTSETFRRSQSERERSLSVSPKTRLPSQTPSQTPSQSRGSFSIMNEPAESNSVHSSKRKMEDRDSPVEQRQIIEQSNARPQVNGNHQAAPVPTPSPQQPPKKKKRYTEPPIWARSFASSGKIAASGRSSKPNFKQAPAPHQAPAHVRPETNGHRHASPTVTRPPPQPEPAGHSLLGPWEESITGQKPVEQLSKIVADWLYLKVVSRTDVGELESRGVEVEIEAKLGQLINKDTNERYYLPVDSECILADTGRVGFRSSMTESQHKSLNEFLNAKVAETHPAFPGQTKKRVPIAYLHRRERDKFYELNPAAYATLPPAIRAELNPRHTVKIRVTHDQKTNQVLAKIIKARVADLDMYNPNAPLDCRISVNLEMRYDGDIEALIASGEGSRIPDRNKDRLSYSQSHYQIDLTQVTQVSSTNGVNKVEKEHELEIEISTRAVREQGRRAAAGEANEYIKLVEGLMDNVRVLARNVPPP